MISIDDAIELVNEKARMRNPCKCLDCKAEVVLVSEISRLRIEVANLTRETELQADAILDTDAPWRAKFRQMSNALAYACMMLIDHEELPPQDLKQIEKWRLLTKVEV